MITREVANHEKVSIIAKSDDEYVIYLSQRKITSRVADYLDNRKLSIGGKQIRIETIEVMNRYRSDEGLITVRVEGDIDDPGIEEAILDYAQEYIDYILPTRP